MNLEELKLILATIEKAGDGAFFVAVMHFGYPYVSAITMMAVFIVLIVCAKRVLTRLITEIGASEAHLAKWGSALEIETEYFGEVPAEHRHKTIRAIDELVAAHMKGKNASP